MVEGKYYLQRQPHLYFEPDCGFAYTDEEGRLTIQSKSVALNFHAAMINEGLGVELENLRMIQNNTGGTFGYKFCPTMEALLGAAASRSARSSSCTRRRAALTTSFRARAVAKTLGKTWCGRART